MEMERMVEMEKIVETVERTRDERRSTFAGPSGQGPKSLFAEIARPSWPSVQGAPAAMNPSVSSSEPWKPTLDLQSLRRRLHHLLQQRKWDQSPKLQHRGT